MWRLTVAAVCGRSACGGSCSRKHTDESRSSSLSYTPSLCTCCAIQLLATTAMMTPNRKSMPRVPSTTMTTCIWCRRESSDSYSYRATDGAQPGNYRPGRKTQLLVYKC